MAFKVYPIGSKSGFSEESSLDSEKARQITSLGTRMTDFIVSPFNDGDFSLTTSTSSFDVDVAPGEAFMGGHFVGSDSTVTVTVNSSVTSEIFLVVDDAKTDNAAIVAQDKPDSDPTGQYVTKLHEVTSDGSGVTGTTDFRKYTPFPNQSPQESITGLKDTGQGTPDPPSISIASSGTRSVSVTYDTPYQVNVFSVVASLDTISDTQANLGWIHTMNSSLTGFDIKAKVIDAGGSGSTAEFAWLARGQ